ncbi:bile acid:sodium symporter [Paenibacillus flagellatus]|uniref:Bile acid:sodium symporter n=2 Tax=Paenibacillus flagellatus TaxID=2211139 RepID=A0A2V5KG33_9BACL|nr:bile acid:sodium symporter [Paenibacillus flagellatus]
MFVIIPVSLILGFFFYRWLEGGTRLVPYLFAYLTFVMALGCSPAQLGGALRKPLAIVVTLALVHVAAPLAAYGAGTLLFGAGSPYVVGLVLFAVIPLGVSSVIWVGLSGGSVALVLSLIVLDSIVSPFVVPYAIDLLFGADIHFDHWNVMKDLIVIILVPTVLGVAVNAWSKGRAKPVTAPYAAPTSKLAFAAVIVINAAAIAPHVFAMKGELIRLVPAVLLFVAFCYALGWLGSLPFRGRDVVVTITYSSGMRNISLGIVIALHYFEPAAAVPVVMAILIQQPMATLAHRLQKNYWQKRGTGVTISS